jgi:urease accessory protein
MVRAVAVSHAGSDDDAVRDTLLLDHAARRLPGGILTGLRGTVVEMALPRGTRLHHDDRLVLEDGGTIGIVARPEPLLEIRSPELAALARAAWLLGDHHIPVEIHERRLRVLRTDPVAELVRSLGLVARPIEAPFEPEGGAYDHVNDVGA